MRQLNVTGGGCGKDQRQIEQIATACMPLFRQEPGALEGRSPCSLRDVSRIFDPDRDGLAALTVLDGKEHSTE